jgi:DNA-directed RNA polymerase specialized sigma24 family protein
LRTKQRRNGIPIRDLHAYLFRAFIRRVNKATRRDLPLVDSPPRHLSGWSVSTDLESKILLDEFLTRCDPVTRDMLYRRIQGFSWKEIGKFHGISAHAAESRFSQALQRVRKKLGLRD